MVCIQRAFSFKTNILFKTLGLFPFYFLRTTKISYFIAFSKFKNVEPLSDAVSEVELELRGIKGKDLMNLHFLIKKSTKALRIFI